jgi:hypothetical protein
MNTDQRMTRELSLRSVFISVHPCGSIWLIASSALSDRFVRENHIIHF